MGIREIQDRRDARRKALDAARDVQLEVDLARLDALEEQYGFERVVRIDLPGWDPMIGGPTMAVVRIPKHSEAILKRFESEVSKAKEGSEARITAQNTLGRACMEYPSPTKDAEDFTRVMDTAPGLLAQAALVVIRRAQGIATEEGKD